MRIGILLTMALALTFEFQGAACGRRNPPAHAQSTANLNGTNMNQDNNQEPDEIWGGDHIQIDVHGDIAKAEFDCAHGEISRALKPDAQGNFDLPGTLVQESAGPTRSDRMPAARTVNYRGKIEGDSMTLSITFSDGNESAGTFTLKRGKHGRIRKCM